MIVTCSHRSSTRSSWWLENSTQHPACARSTRTCPMASIPVGSSPAKGSSSTRSSGSWTSAAASWTRCWFPCESASTLLSARSAMSRRSSHTSRGSLRVRLAQTVQSSQVLNLLADEHGRVEAPFLGHIAEPAALGLADRSPVPAHLSRVEIGQSEDRPHRGRLACAVRPEKSDDMPGGDVERQIVEGGQWPNVRRSRESSSRPTTLFRLAMQRSDGESSRNTGLAPSTGRCSHRPGCGSSTDAGITSAGARGDGRPGPCRPSGTSGSTPSRRTRTTRVATCRRTGSGTARPRGCGS